MAAIQAYVPPQAINDANVIPTMTSQQYQLEFSNILEGLTTKVGFLIVREVRQLLNGIDGLPTMQAKDLIAYFAVKMYIFYSCCFSSEGLMSTVKLAIKEAVDMIIEFSAQFVAGAATTTAATTTGATTKTGATTTGATGATTGATAKATASYETACIQWSDLGRWYVDAAITSQQDEKNTAAQITYAALDALATVLPYTGHARRKLYLHFSVAWYLRSAFTAGISGNIIRLSDPNTLNYVVKQFFARRLFFYKNNPRAGDISDVPTNIYNATYATLMNLGICSEISSSTIFELIANAESEDMLRDLVKIAVNSFRGGYYQFMKKIPTIVTNGSGRTHSGFVAFGCALVRSNAENEKNAIREANDISVALNAFADNEVGLVMAITNVLSYANANNLRVRETVPQMQAEYRQSIARVNGLLHAAVRTDQETTDLLIFERTEILKMKFPSVTDAMIDNILSGVFDWCSQASRYYVLPDVVWVTAISALLSFEVMERIIRNTTPQENHIAGVAGIAVAYNCYFKGVTDSASVERAVLTAVVHSFPVVLGETDYLQGCRGAAVSEALITNGYGGLYEGSNIAYFVVDGVRAAYTRQAQVELAKTSAQGSSFIYERQFGTYSYQTAAEIANRRHEADDNGAHTVAILPHPWDLRILNKYCVGYAASFPAINELAPAPAAGEAQINLVIAQLAPPAHVEAAQGFTCVIASQYTANQLHIDRVRQISRYIFTQVPKNKIAFAAAAHQIGILAINWEGAATAAGCTWFAKILETVQSFGGKVNLALSLRLLHDENYKAPPFTMFNTTNAVAYAIGRNIDQFVRGDEMDFELRLKCVTTMALSANMAVQPVLMTRDVAYESRDAYSWDIKYASKSVGDLMLRSAQGDLIRTRYINDLTSISTIIGEWATNDSRDIDLGREKIFELLGDSNKGHPKLVVPVQTFKLSGDTFAASAALATAAAQAIIDARAAARVAAHIAAIRSGFLLRARGALPPPGGGGAVVPPPHQGPPPLQSNGGLAATGLSPIARGKASRRRNPPPAPPAPISIGNPPSTPIPSVFSDSASSSASSSSASISDSSIGDSSSSVKGTPVNQLVEHAFLEPVSLAQSSSTSGLVSGDEHRQNELIRLSGLSHDDGTQFIQERIKAAQLTRNQLHDNHLDSSDADSNLNFWMDKSREYAENKHNAVTPISKSGSSQLRLDDVYGDLTPDKGAQNESGGAVAGKAGGLAAFTPAKGPNSEAGGAVVPQAKVKAKSQEVDEKELEALYDTLYEDGAKADAAPFTPQAKGTNDAGTAPKINFKGLPPERQKKLIEQLITQKRQQTGAIDQMIINTRRERDISTKNPERVFFGQQLTKYNAEKIKLQKEIFALNKMLQK